MGGFLKNRKKTQTFLYTQTVIKNFSLTVKYYMPPSQNNGWWGIAFYSLAALLARKNISSNVVVDSPFTRAL